MILHKKVQKEFIYRRMILSPVTKEMKNPYNHEKRAGHKIYKKLTIIKHNE